MKKQIIIWAMSIVIYQSAVMGFFVDRWYTYSNADGSFRFEEIPGKGFTATSVYLAYGHFMCQHPDKAIDNNSLYRNFTIQPWRFWEGRQMIMHIDRFELPYKELNTEY